MLREASLLFIVWRTKGAYGCGETREADDNFFEIKYIKNKLNFFCL